MLSNTGRIEEWSEAIYLPVREQARDYVIELVIINLSFWKAIFF